MFLIIEVKIELKTSTSRVPIEKFKNCSMITKSEWSLQSGKYDSPCEMNPPSMAPKNRPIHPPNRQPTIQKAAQVKTLSMKFKLKLSFAISSRALWKSLFNAETSWVEVTSCCFCRILSASQPLFIQSGQWFASKAFNTEHFPIKSRIDEQTLKYTEREFSVKPEKTLESNCNVRPKYALSKKIYETLNDLQVLWNWQILTLVQSALVKS